MRAAVLATVLLLAACSRDDGGGNNSSGAEAGGGQTEAAPSGNLTEDPQNGMVPLASPTPGPSPVAAVPDAYRGRWAAVAHDCTDGGPGLLVVDAGGWSVGGARRGGSLTAAGDSLELRQPGAQGAPAERLSLIEGGRTLMRQQRSPAAATPYLRCPA